ncbi:hypothetical protein CTI12_AA122260 [Artemisia annua]|uniref:Uncharacterized protein n=1 Tax=Artemisia annua TaxID=35608 RepID=A0A2U1PR80_ARTAN|nr:hypothetical protein CTI12_AA122260 [Artemisia annua]
MSVVTQNIRANAEIFYGDEICQEKIKLRLVEMGLPNNLLPLKGIEECGYVKDTGFVWIRLKNEMKYNNEKIKKVTSYTKEITAFMEKFKIKKLTGVKSKELLMWIPLSEVSVDTPPTGKITFRTSSGFYKSYPVSFFQIEDVKKDTIGASVAKEAQVVKEV